MTDGIIQQVIKRYRLRKQEDEELDLTWYEVNQMFTKIQQELIEKIKQEFNDNKSIVNIKSENTGLFHLEDILLKLIGGNQE